MTRQRVPRKQIVQGARKAFLLGGYDETSTDQVAAAAGVSKATVYTHFRSKKEMFLAVIEAECEGRIDAATDIDCDTENIAGALRSLARNVISLLLTPEVLDMYRVAVSGSRRFPEFGDTFYSAGPELGMRSIARCLCGFRANKLLAFSDSEMTARQFGQLCKSDLFYRALFRVQDHFSEVEITSSAKEASRIFLLAFGTTETKEWDRLSRA